MEALRQGWSVYIYLSAYLLCGCWLCCGECCTCCALYSRSLYWSTDGRWLRLVSVSGFLSFLSTVSPHSLCTIECTGSGGTK